MASKPLTPEEVKKTLQFLHRPAVFLNMTEDWPGLKWTLGHLALCLERKSVCFRIGKRCAEISPLFETECSYIQGTLAEFMDWTQGHSDAASVGPFSNYPLSEYWAYADYKYIALLFQEKPNMFGDVVWSDFGFAGRDGRESTIWIGTNGANTPCHQDSYGCNLVFQIQGRKEWHLFPPEDVNCLYPTRIPYEESSVFSQVNVVRPKLCQFPAFQKSRAHRVVLHPGQVLFVPRHWWHYVESVDPVTVSVNSWIEMDIDDEARIGEALTKTIICAIKSTSSQDNKDKWLNPTEESITSHDENMQYLNLAVKAHMDKRSSQVGDCLSSVKPACTSVLKRDACGQFKVPVTEPVSSFAFGPHLIPVTCDSETSPTHIERSRGDDDPASQTSKTNCLSSATPGKENTMGGSDRPGHDRDDTKQGSISTNDMLDCLLHPDVIAMVTRLMINRQGELNSKETIKK